MKGTEETSAPGEEMFDPDHGGKEEKGGKENTGQLEVAASSSPNEPKAKTTEKATTGKARPGRKQKTVAPKGTTALNDTPSEQSDEHLLLLKQT